MSVHDRVLDADALWAAGRHEGALLSILVAVSAQARAEYPTLGDGDAFRTFLGRHHGWSISVEHRGRQVEIDQMFWKWLRCELADTAKLPPDISFTGALEGLTVRAGGAPGYRVLLSHDWFSWLRGLVAGAEERK